MYIKKTLFFNNLSSTRFVIYSRLILVHYYKSYIIDKCTFYTTNNRHDLSVHNMGVTSVSLAHSAAT